MNHFVVVVPYCVAELQNQLTDRFKQRGFAWWHWGTECWLLGSDDPNLDAAGVRSIVREIIFAPEVAFLVLRVDMPQSGINWATNGSLLSAKDWAAWLRQVWQNIPDWELPPTTTDPRTP